MTACNVHITPTKADIYTDGAWLRPDGTLDHVRPKVALLPHLPAVITTQGGSDLLALVAPHFERLFSTFDEMVAGAPAFMREPPEQLRPYLRSFAVERVFLIGFSEAAGEMQGFYLQSVDVPGLAAWETAEFTISVTPSTPAIAATLRPDPMIDQPHYNLALMQQQRGISGDIGNGVFAHAVGGFCQLTTITEDGIETGILVRWPDQVGERIAGIPIEGARL